MEGRLGGGAGGGCNVVLEVFEEGSGVDVIDAGAEAGPSNASIGGLGGARDAGFVDVDCVVSPIDAALGVSELTESCRCLLFDGLLDLGCCSVAQPLVRGHQSLIMSLEKWPVPRGKKCLYTVDPRGKHAEREFGSFVEYGDANG